jgi:hypothetical protein
VVSARLLLLGLALASCAVQAERGYTGEARDPDDDALLYEEQHLLRQDGDRPRERLVLYRCPDGAAFARKQVSYDVAGTAPAFALEDARFGYREGLRRDAAGLTVYVQAAAAAPERRAALVPQAGLVVDAGFDEFVRRHWARLAAGEAVALQFLVPSRLAPLAFKLRRIGSERIDGAPASRFRLAVGGLLGWFAPDITLAYRDADRRLMRFEGLTNIRADRDDNLVARISFPPGREVAALAPGAWAAALAEPLRACTPGGT